MLQAALLGLIQGLTEFLPVSSSGHLTLLGNWLETRDEDVSFELLLHCGTLLATLIIFWRPITDLVRGILQKEKSHLRMGFFITLTTFVTGILGKTFEDPLERMFQSPRIVCFMLILTGILLFLPKVLKKTGETSKGEINYLKALMIGVTQACAIIPGISRSGTTISTCLLLGFSRKAAGEYSFLISVPIIFAATLFKIPDALSHPHHFSGLETSVGILVSFLSGIFALKFLLIFVHKGRLHYFSWYCWFLGAAGLLMLQ